MEIHGRLVISFCGHVVIYDRKRTKLDFFVSLFFDFEKKPRCFLYGTIQANGGTTVEITVEIPDPTDRLEEDVISLTTAFGLLLQRVYATMACHFFQA